MSSLPFLLRFQPLSLRCLVSSLPVKAAPQSPILLSKTIFHHRSIKSKKLLSVFKLKGKLVYIAISKVKGESESFLESQIDALHYLMISLLTSQIDTRLAERPGMDLRSQIDGWDSTLAM